MHLSIPAADFSQGRKTRELSPAAIHKITREIELFFGLDGRST
jgi:hypothetical protein